MPKQRHDLFEGFDMDDLFEKFVRAKAKANQLNHYFPNAGYSPRIDLLRREVRIEPLCAFFEQAPDPSRISSRLMKQMREW